MTSALWRQVFVPKKASSASAYGYNQPIRHPRSYRCVPSARPKTQRYLLRFRI